MKASARGLLVPLFLSLCLGACAGMDSDNPTAKSDTPARPNVPERPAMPDRPSMPGRY